MLVQLKLRSLRKSGWYMKQGWWHEERNGPAGTNSASAEASTAASGQDFTLCI